MEEEKEEVEPEEHIKRLSQIWRAKPKSEEAK